MNTARPRYRYPAPVGERQPNRSVSFRPGQPRGEDVFARLAGIERGAHDRIIKAKHDATLAVEAFLEAGQPERAIWFASEIMGLLEVGPKYGTVSEASVAEQVDDGAEDVRWEEYRANPSELTKRAYERAAHKAIASTLAKLRTLREASA